MSTFSYSATNTFSETHAAHHAGRIVTDLRQCFHEYGSPAETMLEKYLEELKVLISRHFVFLYHFGFERNDIPIWSLQYEISQHGNWHAESDLAGGIPRGINVRGASFFNFLTYSSAWFNLSEQEREAIRALLPFRRTTGTLPGNGVIMYSADRTYNAGGVGTQRSAYGGAI